MMKITSGIFLMGSPSHENGRYANEGPQRQVTIECPFALGKYEVTRAEFRFFVSANGHEAPECMLADGTVRLDDRSRDWSKPGYKQTEDDPVVCVSWDDAKAYVRWLSEKTGESYRLPSEAEWEYAARAGRATRYFWGDDTGAACAYANGHDRKSKTISGLRYDAFPCADDYTETAPVGSFRPDDFGLHDMTGNVWEWVEDAWHASYENAPIDGRAWNEPNEERRVLRGGSWSYNPRNLRSAARREAPRSSRNVGLGFRVAMTLSP
ncbi:MAG: formylglycine-generating enzyme family protein [Pseudomonadota bacterium]